MNGDCIIGVEHKQRIIALENQVLDLKAVDDKLWLAMDHIRDRLPGWATILIAGLSAVSGSAITLAISKAIG